MIVCLSVFVGVRVLVLKMCVMKFLCVVMWVFRMFLCVDVVVVEIRYEGKTYNLEVVDGDNILDVVFDVGIDLWYDCKMGVCMMCLVKVVVGVID